MKTFISILIILIIGILSIGIIGAEPKKCPEGTYDIGISKTDEPLCKIIPTGCHYGDSIPMEKCYEVKEVPVAQTEEVIEYEPYIEGTK